MEIYVAIDAYLSLEHLALQLLAFNAQTHSEFRVIYLNQRQDSAAVRGVIKGAHFYHSIYDLPYPYLDGVCCWELVRVMGTLTESSSAEYMTYLHQECIPSNHFVNDLLVGIKAAEAHSGQKDNVYILNQLRTPQTISELEGKRLCDLDRKQAVSWVHHRPHQCKDIFKEQAWEEDAFALPMALIRTLKLFACVPFPLYFLDLFDLIFQLEDKPYCKGLRWFRLGQPVIYHLNHARSFLEYSQKFLTQVKLRPDLFGHLALYELAQSKFDYHEPFKAGQRIIRSNLHGFVQYMKYSDRGSVTLWSQALDRAQTEVK